MVSPMQFYIGRQVGRAGLGGWQVFGTAQLLFQNFYQGTEDTTSYFSVL